MKTGFLISKAAGKDKYGAWQKKIEEIYGKESVIITDKAGDVFSMSKKFSQEGGDLLVLLGGDGSLSEASEALAFTDTALGLIPTGSGNDFSRLFDYDRVDLENLQSCPIDAIDLIEVNGKIGINVLSLGFDSNSLSYTYKFNEKFGKTTKLSYIYGPLASIIRRELLDLKLDLVESSGEKLNIQGKYLISAICNGSYYGSGFMPSPNGLINDGKLNLILIEPLSPLRILSLFIAYRKGGHLGLKGVREILIKSGRITSEKEFLYNLDGHLFKGNTLDFKILDKALKWAYIAPPKKRK